MHQFASRCRIVSIGNMNQNYEKLFTCIKPQDPPAWLFSAIMARIQKEELLLSIRKRFVLFSAVVLVSIGAFIPTINAFRVEFAQSGFSQFFPLVFSDMGAVIANWQDFCLVLLESLPATSLIAFLAILLVFCWSLKHLFQAIKIIFLPIQLIHNQ